MKKDSMIYTVFFVFCSTFVLIFILSLSHLSTKKIVAKHQDLLLKKSILRAFNIKYKTSKDVYNKFSEKINILQKNGNTLYMYIENNKEIYAKLFSGSGLWGIITGIIAVNKDVDQIYGLSIISHNETPGLGARIEEKWFLDQFRNERLKNTKITIGNKGSGKGDYDNNNSRLDAITGATSTTNFLQDIINNNLISFKKIMEQLNE